MAEKLEPTAELPSGHPRTIGEESANARNREPAPTQDRTQAAIEAAIAKHNAAEAARFNV